MKKLLLYILPVLLIAMSCSEIELDTEDPNNFADAEAKLLISGPQLANCLLAEGELARLGGIFSNQFTGADRQYITYNQYNIVAGDFDNIWGTVYADGIAQCRIIREKATADGDDVLVAIAKIIEANILGMATALWGDIPQSEACDVENYPTPAYDGQVSVYNYCITLLDEAIATGLTGIDPVTEEPIPQIYLLNEEGATTSHAWLEVANSIKARLYLHLGDYDNALTAAQNGISSGAGDWMFYHPGDPYPNIVTQAMNIYWDFCVWNRDGYMGAGDAYLVDLMQTRNDSRLYHYYHPPGYWNNDWYPAVWGGGAIFDAGEDFPMITYYETQLIIAECEMIENGDRAAAITALNNVQSYWETRLDDLWGADDYFTLSVDADFATDADLLEEILTEKYISCYGQLEAFNDMRRTDNYIGVPFKAGQTAHPERMLVPQSEINSNPNATTFGTFEETPVNAGAYPGV